MNDIKTIDRQTHKLTNGLTKTVLYNFQTHPIFDLESLVSENQNGDAQAPNYTEVEYLESDDGAEYLDIDDEEKGVEVSDIEMVNANFDANTNVGEDVNYTLETSDVDTDVSAELPAKRKGKAIKLDKDSDKYREVNVKTKVNELTDVESDTSEETVEMRKKVEMKKLLLKNSAKAIEEFPYKESLAAFKKEYNCTVKLLSKEEQREEVEERKRNNKSAYCCDLCGKGFRDGKKIMAHLSYHDPVSSNE